MSRKQHRFHGSPERFEVTAEFIAGRYGRDITYIADVAGGQGMLARILNKRFNYRAEVIDPRGWTLKGTPSRAELFDPTGADYYDLVVGLHPDQAIRAVAKAALVRPVLLAPCCNFWSEHEKLGRDALVDAVCAWYDEHGVRYELHDLDFKGPYNRALVSEPPAPTDPPVCHGCEEQAGGRGVVLEPPLGAEGRDRPGRAVQAGGREKVPEPTERTEWHGRPGRAVQVDNRGAIPEALE